jgi:hypothetical protein
MKHLSFLFVVVLCFSCNKKDPPKPPESATLVFPENNSECTTGVETGLNTTMVEFKWQQAPNADTYELRATNVNTNTTQTVSTSGLSAKLPLQKGALYTWVVSTRNKAVLQAATSQTWRFYNAGFETSYAPFPAEILLPELGNSVFKNINNEVMLRWSGSDLDNDIVSYELYFSVEKPPTSLIATITTGTMNRSVTVESDTVYYWKVITIDSEGNTSDSGVFDFKVQ